VNEENGTFIVAADRGRCCGSGNCASVLPEVFTQDAAGLVVARAARQPARRLAAAAEAALLCPGRAIIIRDTTATARG
jgi:ferredoxin